MAKLCPIAILMALALGVRAQDLCSFTAAYKANCPASVSTAVVTMNTYQAFNTALPTLCASSTCAPAMSKVLLDSAAYDARLPPNPCPSASLIYAGCQRDIDGQLCFPKLLPMLLSATSLDARVLCGTCGQRLLPLVGLGSISPYSIVRLCAVEGCPITTDNVWDETTGSQICKEECVRRAVFQRYTLAFQRSIAENMCSRNPVSGRLCLPLLKSVQSVLSSTTSDCNQLRTAAAAAGCCLANGTDVAVAAGFTDIGTWFNRFAACSVQLPNRTADCPVAADEPATRRIMLYNMDGEWAGEHDPSYYVRADIANYLGVPPWYIAITMQTSVGPATLPNPVAIVQMQGASGGSTASMQERLELLLATRLGFPLPQTSMFYYGDSAGVVVTAVDPTLSQLSAGWRAAPAALWAALALCLLYIAALG